MSSKDVEKHMAKFEKMISMNISSTKMIGTNATKSSDPVDVSSVLTSKSFNGNGPINNEKQLSIQERRAAFEKRKASYRRTKRQLSKDLEFTIEHLKKIEIESEQVVNVEIGFGLGKKAAAAAGSATIEDEDLLSFQQMDMKRKVTHLRSKRQLSKDLQITITGLVDEVEDESTTKQETTESTDDGGDRSLNRPRRQFRSDVGARGSRSGQPPEVVVEPKSQQVRRTLSNQLQSVITQLRPTRRNLSTKKSEDGAKETASDNSSKGLTGSKIVVVIEEEEDTIVDVVNDQAVEDAVTASKTKKKKRRKSAEKKKKKSKKTKTTTTKSKKKSDTDFSPRAVMKQKLSEMKKRIRQLKKDTQKDIETMRDEEDKKKEAFRISLEKRLEKEYSEREKNIKASNEALITYLRTTNTDLKKMKEELETAIAEITIENEKLAEQSEQMASDFLDVAHIILKLKKENEDLMETEQHLRVEFIPLYERILNHETSNANSESTQKTYYKHCLDKLGARIAEQNDEQIQNVYSLAMEECSSKLGVMGCGTTKKSSSILSHSSRHTQTTETTCEDLSSVEDDDESKDDLSSDSSDYDTDDDSSDGEDSMPGWMRHYCGSYGDDNDDSSVSSSSDSDSSNYESTDDEDDDL